MAKLGESLEIALGAADPPIGRRPAVLMVEIPEDDIPISLHRSLEQRLQLCRGKG
jgi:hypothetical protein